MNIDSHHHFWNYSQEEYDWIPEDIIRKDFGPRELKPCLDDVGIGGVISVQARTDDKENGFLLGYAESNDWIKGVVGYADLTAEGSLEKLAAHPKMRGVREVLQGMDDDAYCLRDDFNRGISKLLPLGLVYDILIFHRHLRNAIEFVDRHPEQVFVLDHIAKPEITGAAPDSAWVANMKELGKRENVFCKLSGMATEVRGDSARDANLFRPYFETSLEAFGADRLMYGSDWPVCLLELGYSRWVALVRECTSSLSAAEQSEIWGGTAARAYSLSI